MGNNSDEVEACATAEQIVPDIKISPARMGRDWPRYLAGCLPRREVLRPDAVRALVRESGNRVLGDVAVLDSDRGRPVDGLLSSRADE
jgi:hypothetical protein